MISWDLLFIPAFCLAAYLFFGAVYAILIWRIRWEQLATVYPSDMLQDAKSFGVRSVSIGKAGFPLGLDVKVTTAGLYLATPWFFRFELPAIFIPWEEMKPIGHYQFWLRSIAHVVFSVKLPQDTQLKVESQIFYNAEKYLPENFIENFRMVKRVIE